MDLLERNGCPLKTERGNRVFPVSDKSSDVISALSRPDAGSECGCPSAFRGEGSVDRGRTLCGNPAEEK